VGNKIFAHVNAAPLRQQNGLFTLIRHCLNDDVWYSRSESQDAATWAEGKGTLVSCQKLTNLMKTLSTEDQEGLIGLFQTLLSVPEKKSCIYKDKALIEEGQFRISAIFWTSMVAVQGLV
jgi:hypothetical protein